MSSATLHGADHVGIGEIASVAEGRAALALSRGGAKKTYPHRDPNEDVAGFALSEWGAVAVVADGHAGCTAASVAVRQVLDAHAARWLEPAPIALDTRFRSEAVEVAADVNAAILRATTGSPRQGSRTTLVVALLRPRDGWIGTLSVGDSHAFLADDGAARELVPLAGERTLFLGDPALDAERLAAGLRVDVDPLERGRALVLASDGLSEHGIGVADPAGAVGRAVAGSLSSPPELRPLETARSVIEQSLAAHRQHRAGDNAAAAVLWID